MIGRGGGLHVAGDIAEYSGRLYMQEIANPVNRV